MSFLNLGASTALSEMLYILIFWPHLNTSEWVLFVCLFVCFEVCRLSPCIEYLSPSLGSPYPDSPTLADLGLGKELTLGARGLLGLMAFPS